MGSKAGAGRFLPVLVVGLGALNFFWQLGSPSLYIDEAFSWYASAGSAEELFDRVLVNEVAPWTYYLGLHAWIFAFDLQDGDEQHREHVGPDLLRIDVVAAADHEGLVVGARSPQAAARSPLA